MEVAQLRYFIALFIPAVPPIALFKIVQNHRGGNEQTLMEKAARAYIRNAAYEKSAAVIAVLKTEEFRYFRGFIIQNNPRSSLFYFKNCVFRGSLSFVINSRTLFLIETHLQEHNVFLRMNHSQKEGYSMKTINKFLKISAAKELEKVVVSIPYALEEEMDMKKRMAKYAAASECHMFIFDMGTDLLIVIDRRVPEE